MEEALSEMKYWRYRKALENHLVIILKIKIKKKKGGWGWG